MTSDISPAHHHSAALAFQHSFEDLLNAINSSDPVLGSTHRFYRYPARFSPDFATQAINAFTEPGDLVMDPFMGGGTSIVEALTLGRRALGCDINSLAGFLVQTKTSPLSNRDVGALVAWQMTLGRSINLHKTSSAHERWVAYQRNVPWWLRKTLEQALSSTLQLETPRQRRFARCSLLRTAQWALDCRAKVPTKAEFLQRHHADLSEMLLGIFELSLLLKDAFGRGWRRAVRTNKRILVRNAAGLDTDGRIPKTWQAPKLVLTSPPYVGVHILYHRWQVCGRRETPAPYWVAGELDGRPNTYYNFAERRRKGMGQYLASLRDCFRSIVNLMDGASTLVQLVAFARPEQQLSPYLGALNELGLEETDVGGMLPPGGGVSRTVPNRKWYADVKGQLGASQEFLLVHRKY